MSKNGEPMVLELAALPRDQMGPFLLLGLDKSADKKTIEAHWADRVKWSRRQIVKTALEDINWAREMLSDTPRRLRADAASLNSDTTDGTLTALARRHGLEGGQTVRLWRPLDSERDLADYKPAAEIPEIDAIRAALTVPPAPEEVPAVPILLRLLVGQPLDPWALDLSPAGETASPLPT
jgi:hypothetical protein